MNGIWTTRDGEVLKISEMTTSHIRNCVAMLDRILCKAINRSYDGEVNVPEEFEQTYFELNEELMKRENLA